MIIGAAPASGTSQTSATFSTVAPIASKTHLVVCRLIDFSNNTVQLNVGRRLKEALWLYFYWKVLMLLLLNNLLT